MIYLLSWKLSGERCLQQPIVVVIWVIEFDATSLIHETRMMERLNLNPIGQVCVFWCCRVRIWHMYAIRLDLNLRVSSQFNS
uniref:Uncharacterized protein n=1 Tax=Kalanchoe fedtschenkoi TaxID=63787 RepID=A0A7N0TAY0_KALFE